MKEKQLKQILIEVLSHNEHAILTTELADRIIQAIKTNKKPKKCLIFEERDENG